MSSQLTLRENQLLVLGFKCTETQPKIDYAKLATLAGLKNAGVASVMYGNAKRKLMKFHDNDLTSNTEPGATVPAAAADDAMSLITNTTPATKNTSATKAKAPAKATPTSRKRKASAIDEASPGAGNDADVEASPAKSKPGAFMPKKIKVLNVDLPGQHGAEVLDHDEIVASMKKEQAEADAQLKGNISAASRGGARVTTLGAKNEAGSTTSANPDVVSKVATAGNSTTSVAVAGPKKRGRPAAKKDAGTKTQTTTKTTAKARNSKSQSKTPAPALAPINAASAEVEAAVAAYRASVDRNLEGGELMSSEELDREIENPVQDTPEEQSGVRPGL